MYCNKCGTEIKEEKARFCSACGAPVKKIEVNEKKSYARKPLQTKRLVIIGCIVVVLVTLALVGGLAVRNSNKDSKGTKGTGIFGKKMVRVDNLSVKPLTIYGDNNNIDYASSEGFVIEATIKNNSNNSMDVQPVVEATVEYEDDYGDKQTVHLQIYISSEYTNTDGFHCPYSKEYCSSEGLLPVGVAPKEEKTVRYYFEGKNIIYGYDVDNNNEELQIRNGVIKDVKLIDINYDNADCVYVPASEWKNAVEIKQEDESFVLVHEIREYLAGEIVNDTNCRWKIAQLQMDVQIDGQGYYEIIGADKNYIGIGKSFTFDNTTFVEPLKSTFLKYSEDGHKIEFIPALMYYVPE